MSKGELDKIVIRLLLDEKIYTQAEIRELFKDNLTTDQLSRVYKHYMYLKNKDILK